MDSVEHDPYWDWWKGYKNIDGICASVPQISHILRNPNPSLLQPDALNYLINKLMDYGMHPKHVAGIVRAQYEDPSNGFYLFKKYDAAKWANGWVEILGAQRYFGLG
jgi:hypothetical protein